MVKQHLLTALFCWFGYLTFAIPNGNDFIDLIGHPVSTPELADLLKTLEFNPHSTSFDRNSNTYEIKGLDHGIALLFNQNFVLKEIQFYDSGYLYSAFKGKLPLNLKLRLHHTYFREQYLNFDIDTFNQFIYRSRFVNGTANVYFKANHIEMVQIVADESFIKEQDTKNIQNWGMRLIPNGSCISGNCHTGDGKMLWPSSLAYEGHWEYGIPHGDGLMSDSTGPIYSGSLRLGFLWGDGRLTLPGQYTYKGALLMGKKYGEGEIRYENGSRYNGNWVNDLMHGKGHFHFSETFHYKGDFIDNEFNGKGILYTPEGYLEGGFKNGKPHGKGTQVATANQSTLSGSWINGLKEGKFIASNPLLGTYEVIFENDIEMQKMRME